jgi:hypothetical protein
MNRLGFRLLVLPSYTLLLEGANGHRLNVPLCPSPRLERAFHPRA